MKLTHPARDALRVQRAAAVRAAAAVPHAAGAAPTRTVHDVERRAPRRRCSRSATASATSRTAGAWRGAAARHVYRGSVRSGTVRDACLALAGGRPAVPHPQLYLRATPLTAADDRAASRWAACTCADGVGRGSRCWRLAAAVRERVRYRAGATDVQTTAQQAWALGGGVCQDQAHVFIAACRADGVPARYVSGYFHCARRRRPGQPRLGRRLHRRRRAPLAQRRHHPRLA